MLIFIVNLLSMLAVAAIAILEITNPALASLIAVATTAALK